MKSWHPRILLITARPPSTKSNSPLFPPTSSKPSTRKRKLAPRPTLCLVAPPSTKTMKKLTRPKITSTTKKIVKIPNTMNPNTLTKMPRTKPTANIKKPSKLPNPLFTANTIPNRNPGTNRIANPRMSPNAIPARVLKNSSLTSNPNPTLLFPRRVKPRNPSSRKMSFFFPARRVLHEIPTLHARNSFAVIPRVSVAILVRVSRGRNAADGIVAAIAADAVASTALAEEIVAVIAAPIVAATVVQIAADADASNAAADLAIATARIADIRVDTLLCAAHNSFPKCSSPVRT